MIWKLPACFLWVRYSFYSIMGLPSWRICWIMSVFVVFLMFMCSMNRVPQICSFSELLAKKFHIQLMYTSGLGLFFIFFWEIWLSMEPSFLFCQCHHNVVQSISKEVPKILKCSSKLSVCISVILILKFLHNQLC